MHIINYYSVLFDEAFKIYLDDELEFIGVERFVARIGADPIRYSRLEDIPATFRPHIEKKIATFHPNK